MGFGLGLGLGVWDRVRARFMWSSWLGFRVRATDRVNFALALAQRLGVSLDALLDRLEDLIAHLGRVRVRVRGG